MFDLVENPHIRDSFTATNKLVYDIWNNSSEAQLAHTRKQVVDDLRRRADENWRARRTLRNIAGEYEKEAGCLT